MGLNKPIHILQLGASVDEIVNMTAVTVMMPNNANKQPYDNPLTRKISEKNPPT